MIHHFVKYLQKQNEYDRESTADTSVGMIIVIPCYDEPNLLQTFDCLCKCVLPDCNVGIITVINSPEYAGEERLLQNEKTRISLSDYMSKLPKGFSLSILSVSGIRKKDAGAGFARKIGMDEAVRLFNTGGNERGIIVSLDADCMVSKNYLIEIYRHFAENVRLDTAIIRYEHLLPDEITDPRMFRAGILYELYLRYYTEALKYIGFPYPYHTIGSCFAVTADAYVKVGGMNRKQAGEDFYFLQKMFAYGNTTEINQATVYPSVRISDRVVFGTGPAIRKMLEKEKIDRETFSVNAFTDLKILFSQVDSLFKADISTINELLSNLPAPLSVFMQAENFECAIGEINANSATSVNFRKRFFGWFNAFMILKYLHFVHPKYYDYVSVEKAAEFLLTELTEKQPAVTSVEDLLKHYQKRQ